MTRAILSPVFFVKKLATIGFFFYHKGGEKPKGVKMKKCLLALAAVLMLAACGGYYKQGNCEYEFLFHKDISISKIIGSCR